MLGLRYFLDLKLDSETAERKIREEGAAYIERAMRLPDAPTDLPLLAAAIRTSSARRIGRSASSAR